MQPGATPIHVDRRGSLVDDAVALYERAYDSDDIHVGAAAPDGFSFRFRAVGDRDVTTGSSAVAARRWGTVSARGDYVLVWATSPGMTIDTGSRDPVQLLPGVPVMYPPRPGLRLRRPPLRPALGALRRLVPRVDRGREAG